MSSSNNNNSVEYGLFDSKQAIANLVTLPLDGAKKLKTAPDNNLWSKTFLEAVFLETDFSVLVVPSSDDEVRFDTSSSEALGRAIASSIDIRTVSFKNCVSVASSSSLLSIPQVISHALADGFSLHTLDLTNCGLDISAARNIAKTIPGNKTVNDFIFSENPLIGDEGCIVLTEALKRSKAQRVSFRKCGIENLIRVCDSLMQIDGLYAFDLRENPSYDSDTNARDYLISKQDLLGRNASKNFGRSERVLVPFGTMNAQQTASGNNTNNSEDDNNNSNHQNVADENQEEGQEQITNEEGDGAGGNQNEETQSRTSTSQQQQQHGSSSSLRRWKRKPDIRTEGSSVQRRASTPSSSQPRQQYDSRSTPIRSGQQTKDINDGMDRWKENKDRFNSYIKIDGPHKKVPEEQSIRRLALAQPTYVLGKRVDHIKRTGASSAFRGSPISRRNPTPGEIQKYAPWNNKDKQDNNHPPAVGTRTQIALENSRDPKGNPTIVTIEDGGEISYLDDSKNDPRTIGYRANRLKQNPREPWARSNEQRNLRFGIDERTNGRGIVLKEHQAPDPGFYTVPDEWAERAKRLKAESARKPKPTLVGSTAPRGGVAPAATHHHENPGPGAYEIP